MISGADHRRKNTFRVGRLIDLLAKLRQGMNFTVCPPERRVRMAGNSLIEPGHGRCRLLIGPQNTQTQLGGFHFVADQGCQKGLHQFPFRANLTIAAVRRDFQRLVDEGEGRADRSTSARRGATVAPFLPCGSRLDKTAQFAGGSVWRGQHRFPAHGGYLWGGPRH